MTRQNRHLALVSDRIEQVFETPATAVNGPGAWPAIEELTMTDRTCVWCGEHFIAKLSHAQYCSQRCRTAKHRATQSPEAREAYAAAARLRHDRKRRPLPAVTLIPGEEWRPIPGYEGYYDVSGLGRVRSAARTIQRIDGKTMTFRERELKQHVNTPGYFAVVLSRCDSQRQWGVHQLVCLAFHGPKPTPKHEVRHLNGNPQDNRPDNLRWGTRSENTRDRVVHGTHNQASKTHCPHGHEYTPENTYIRRNRKHGWKGRRCRSCRLEAA